jgi:hypothetical protein
MLALELKWPMAVACTVLDHLDKLEPGQLIEDGSNGVNINGA